jgi:hypothetical protein
MSMMVQCVFVHVLGWGDMFMVRVIPQVLGEQQVVPEICHCKNSVTIFRATEHLGIVKSA